MTKKHLFTKCIAMFSALVILPFQLAVSSFAQQSSSSEEQITESEKAFYLENMVADSQLGANTTVKLLGLTEDGQLYDNEWTFSDPGFEKVTLPDHLDLKTVTVKIYKECYSQPRMIFPIMEYSLEKSKLDDKNLNNFIIYASQIDADSVYYSINLPNSLLQDTVAVYKNEECSIYPADDQVRSQNSCTKAHKAIANELKKNKDFPQVKEATMAVDPSSSDQINSKITKDDQKDQQIVTSTKALHPANFLAIGLFLFASVISIVILFKDEFKKQKQPMNSLK